MITNLKMEEEELEHADTKEPQRTCDATSGMVEHSSHTLTEHL